MMIRQLWQTMFDELISCGMLVTKRVVAHGMLFESLHDPSLHLPIAP